MIQPAVLHYLTTSLRYFRPTGLLVAMVAVLVTVGCTPPEGPAAQQPEVPAIMEEPTATIVFVPESVSDRVLDTAAQEFNVSRADLRILRFNQEVWLDGCLGLGQPNEGCLQALVNGWQLEVVHNNQSWFYRTDATGDAIRRSDLDNNLPPSVQDFVLDAASSDSDVPISQLEVTSAEPEVWDGCLGIVEPEANCTEIAIPGWRAVVQDETQTWVYHTDMTGSNIRLNEADSGE
ncbi:MAG: hypothetical protein F6K42_34820 [Leptolyngbya sp. SIO1D8]|nr:hypothetical protein [Leptolyngbya sp. SIO1D8]